MITILLHAIATCQEPNVIFSGTVNNNYRIVSFMKMMNLSLQTDFQQKQNYQIIFDSRKLNEMLNLIEQNFDPFVASQFAVQYKCIPAENPSKYASF